MAFAVAKPRPAEKMGMGRRHCLRLPDGKMGLMGFVGVMGMGMERWMAVELEVFHYEH